MSVRSQKKKKGLILGCGGCTSFSGNMYTFLFTSSLFALYFSFHGMQVVSLPVKLQVLVPLKTLGADFADESVNDANKGEKSTCKEIVIRSRSMDKDDGRGPGSGEQTREEFLALKPPLSPSPSPKRTQEKSSKGLSAKKPKGQTTRARDGRILKYVPYEEGRKDLGEVTQNYLILKMNKNYAYKIEGLDVLKARREINDMLDLWEAEKLEKLNKKKTSKDEEKIWFSVFLYFH
nr:hypothetical protein Iba_chr05fCG7020 [Ipomoea batatas]